MRDGLYNGYKDKERMVLMMKNILLGANYYPEDWNEDLLDFDIQKMKECSFNVVRIAEFAWKKWSRRKASFHLLGYTR